MTVMVELASMALTVACIFGTFSERFNDNLLQRSGMALMAIGAWRYFGAQDPFPSTSEEVPIVVIVAGLAAFVAGTAAKRRRRRDRQ